jgi:hypothetical protein
MGASVSAQISLNSSFRSKVIPATGDSVVLDSMWLVPGTVQLADLDTSFYQVHEATSTLYWKKPPPKDSVLVQYQVYVSIPEMNVQRKDPKIIDTYFSENPFSYIPKTERRSFTNSDQINTLGNISRGIGFGNRQDVVVNSNLNLRLSGRLQNDIEVLAAISDQDNPVQAQGNTQQLQDFDRVYIQLRKDSTSLIGGDFLMTTPEGSYFLQYNKKSRGLQFEHGQEVAGGTLRLEGEAALSRGRFARNTINGIEGNQGPYRLSGSSGEQFIIVISGTERVYVDGKLLTRGEQNDYVIDYNTGEVIFMPNILITQYSRIIIEFQFSDRNYARSIVHTGGSYTKNGWRLRAHYITEQDNKNQPFQQNLETFDSVNNVSARQVLADAGDQPLAFIQRAVRTENPAEGQILYLQKDTLGETIFAHALGNPENEELFSVSFSFVGQGNGNYIQKISNANGKVFEWVEPIGGIPQGDYAPVEVLIPAKRYQMINLGLDKAFSDKTRFTIDLANSINDLNTFSSLDDSDNSGLAVYAALSDNRDFGKDSTKLWTMSSKFWTERSPQNFRYLERYRNVEFNRIWNRNLENPTENLEQKNLEQIVQLEWRLKKGRLFELATQQAYYANGDNGGISQVGQLLWQPKNWRLESGVERLDAEVLKNNTTNQNSFLRYHVDLEKRGKWLGFQAGFAEENSQFFMPTLDSLESGSYRFRNLNVGVKNGDSTSLQFGLFANQRQDFQPLDGILTPFTIGTDAKANLSWSAKRNGFIQFTGTYRTLEFQDSFATSNTSENTIQGRLETRYNLLKNILKTQTYYQVGTGQEQRREISYLQVGNGLGNYIWNDYNEDGNPTLNEFEIASALDRNRADYIRQFLPIQGFIKSYSSEFNTSIRYQTSSIWRSSEKKTLRFLSKISSVNSIRILKKVTNEDPGAYLNPFASSLFGDTSLLNAQQVIRSMWSFNQSDPIYGIDYQWLSNGGRQLLVNGIDARNQLEHSIRGRYNLQGSVELNMQWKRGRRAFESEFLSDRNYNYQYVSYTPRVGYQYKQSLRVEVLYVYKEAQNDTSYGGERSYIHELTFNSRFASLNKGNLNASIGWVNVNFKGEENTALAYDLLEGLRDGRNFKWNLQIDRRFQNNIQLLFSYEGRASELIDTIHIGRVQARYLF